MAEADSNLSSLNLTEKKKKKKKTTLVMDKNDKSEKPPTKELGELNLGKKKKSKSKDDKKKDGSKKERSEKSKKVRNLKQFIDLNDEETAKFEYDTMLDRVFDSMIKRGIGLGMREQTKFRVDPVKISKMGTKRIVYSNFKTHCENFNRKEAHLKDYILIELGTTGNLGDSGLVIKGKFNPTQMQNILTKYIKDYVLCKTCKSNNTTLEKNERLTFLICNDCMSRSTVLQQKSGFSAIVGKRKKLKEKAALDPGHKAK